MNMHYYYNVEYFQDTLLAGANEASQIYTKHNTTIYDFKFRDDSYLKSIMEEEQLKEDIKSFSLQTVYPGLFIGSGYQHDGSFEGVKNAIIGGFYFDYVTGLPVIPGSTVKGMLRSYFQEGEKWSMVKELAKKPEADLEKMIENFFEGKDVFIGGFPATDRGRGTQMLDSEYITPHKDQFKNPIPLSLLKIRPGIRFEFVFLLYDYIDVDEKTIIMTADEKKELYKKLLRLGGIGAKTNVGFGQFEEMRR